MAGVFWGEGGEGSWEKGWWGCGLEYLSQRYTDSPSGSNEPLRADSVTPTTGPDTHQQCHHNTIGATGSRLTPSLSPQQQWCLVRVLPPCALWLADFTFLMSSIAFRGILNLHALISSPPPPPTPCPKHPTTPKDYNFFLLRFSFFFSCFIKKGLFTTNSIAPSIRGVGNGLSCTLILL